LPGDNFSLKLKHVARNKTGINLVVIDGLYFSHFKCFSFVEN